MAVQRIRKLDLPVTRRASREDDMEFAPGDTIGEYRILDIIGNGGFSVVYHAEDMNLERPVAIKQLMPEAFSEEGTREWFIREARLTASLSHPNIVQIHSLRAEGDLIFLVMEYLPSDLHTLVRRSGPLDRPKLMKVTTDICRALETLHARNVIHRDVKPENILIGAEGQFKLADFGLAHIPPRRRQDPDDSSGPQPGTLLYMSPEQAFGRTVTARSDIYSLAIVLYEAITGHYYFDYDEEDGTDDELLDLIEEGDPLPLDRHHRTIPPEIIEPLHRALSKDPDERPPTARAFLSELKTAVARSKHLTLSKKRRSMSSDRPVASPELLDELYAIRTLRDAEHQPELAMEHMRTIWRNHPGIPEVAAEWGETLIASGRPEDGRTWIEGAIRMNPNLPFAQLALADLYRDVDENDEEADAATIRAIIIDPDLAYAVLYDDIVAALDEPEVYEHYVILFRQAVTVTPTPPVLHNLAQVLTLDQQLEDSVALFERALAQDPDYGPAAVGLASILVIQSHTAAAIPHLEHARFANYPRIPAGDWHKTNTVYQAIHAQLALAIAYAQVGQFENSAIAARAVLDLDQDELAQDATALLKAYVIAARKWIRAGDALRAYKFLNQVIPMASIWGNINVFALLEETQTLINGENQRPEQWDDALEWLRKGAKPSRRPPQNQQPQDSSASS
jgi:serine/threonine protein kinase